MQRYLVLLATKTNLKFVPEEAAYIFNIGTSRVLFRRINNIKDEIISGLKHGWIIDIQLDEDNIQKAVDKAVGMSEFFLSAFCFETGQPVHRSISILSFEISENINKRIFRQYFYNLGYSGSDVEIPFSPFDEKSNRINEIKGRYKYRIYRAIRWFRKGIIGDDPIDQFLFFWQGLESLNSVLATHYNCSKDKNIPVKCKICKKEYYIKGPSIGGIDALCEDIGIEDSVKKEIKDTRNSITHGWGKISDLYEPTIKLLPIIAKILHCGIAKVIPLSFDKSVHNNLKKVAPVKIGDFLYIEGFLKEEDISKLGKENYYPFWHPEIAPSILIIGDITLNFDSRKNFIGCEYQHTSIGVSGVGIDVKFKSASEGIFNYRIK